MYSNRKQLPFHILDVPARLNRRYSSTEQFSPQSRIPDVNRSFDNFGNPKNVEVTFPIELTGIRAIPSLAPGEGTKFFINLKNISTKDYGSEGELARAIGVTLNAQTLELAKYFSVRNSSGKLVPLEKGLVAEIRKLASGETKSVEGSLFVSSNTPYYTWNQRFRFGESTEYLIRSPGPICNQTPCPGP